MEQKQKEFSGGRCCAPEGQSLQNNGPIATVVEIGPDGDGKVHIVKLKAGNSKPEQIIWSPISKLLWLVEVDKIWVMFLFDGSWLEQERLVVI